jgi:hypothetical protein
MAEDMVQLLGQVQAEIAGHLTGTGAALAPRSVELNEARARRLAATRDRLAEELGRDDPRVVELSRRHAFISEINRELAAFVERQRSPAKLGVREWQLHGRVVDGTGRPVAGVQVRVVDPQRELAVVVEATVTDQRGEFSAVYHLSDLAPEGEPPDLAVAVHDAKGTQLLRSEETVKPAARQSDYVEIVLTRHQPASRDRCEAQTTRGARCKNPTEPGSRFCGVHRL